MLLFLDDERGIEIVERSSGSSSLPAGRRIDTVDSALAYAAMIGFPNQGILVHAQRDDRVVTNKTLSSTAELAHLLETCLHAGMTLTVLPDHRAHRSPARAERIRALCQQMARRLATPCPACATPGYGLVEVARGVPCALCGEATSAIAADIYGCQACDERDRRPHSRVTADPASCDQCNP